MPYFEVEKEAREDVLEVSIEDEDGDVNILIGGAIVAYFNWEDGKLHLVPTSIEELSTDSAGYIEVEKD